MSARDSLRRAFGLAPARPQDALLGAATALKVGRERVVPTSTSWQEEAWRQYDALGEFRYGVTWKSNMISRCRLLAAEAPENQGDEPNLLDSGPAVDLMAELGGGVDGQAQMLATLAAFLLVPGEGYVIGEAMEGGENRWQVRSAEELRRGRGKNVALEILDEESPPDREKWRPLADDSLVVRVWRPHKRKRHLADSPSRAALGVMRELELVNRYIQAQYLSRLASAGLIVFPNEVTFPGRPEFQNEPDPFVAEWIEMARTAIKEPGTASAVVPIPIKVPGEYVDKIRLIDFTLALDEHILEKRESAIKRLATSLDMPAEVLTGLGDINHWGQWFTEESAVKTNVSPDMELICHCLTVGYLRPRLEAEGRKSEGLLVWYDPSELTQRPDRSEAAKDAYDRLEISGEALRREVGFSEDDKPTDEERDQMALLALLKVPAVAALAAEELGVLDAPEPAPAPGGPGQPADREAPADGPPPTRDTPPPSRNGKTPARQP